MTKARTRLFIAAMGGVCLLGIASPSPGAESAASGRTVYVDASSGSDSNDCLAADRACRTIQRGAAVVRGGDRMLVGPGVYYERPYFQNLGSSATAPVWILAEPRGAATISGMWKEAALGQVAWDDAADGITGDGVFSAPHNPALFGAYQGTYLFRYNNVADLRAGRAGSLNATPYGIASGGGRVYVKLPGSIDPNGRVCFHLRKLCSQLWSHNG